MKKGKGLASLVWVLVAVGIILAVLQVSNINTIDEAIGKSKEKAVYYSKCIPSGECGLMSILDGIKPEDLIIGQPNKNNSPNKDNLNNKDNSDNKDDLDSKDNLDNKNSKDNKEDLDNKDKLVSNRDPVTYSKNIDLNSSKIYLSQGEVIEGKVEQKFYYNKYGTVDKNTALRMVIEIKGREQAENSFHREDVDKEVPEENQRTPHKVSEWKHWRKITSCWSLKDEMLYRESQSDTPVILLNKKAEVTANKREACAIGRLIIENGKRVIDTKDNGLWLCPYSGQQVTDIKNLELDHIVSLQYASEHGGRDWTLASKEKFANDENNLLVISKEEYAKKAKGTELTKYTPSNKEYKCEYVKNFVSIVYKYDLSMTSGELKFAEKTLRMCKK